LGIALDTSPMQRAINQDSPTDDDSNRASQGDSTFDRPVSVTGGEQFRNTNARYRGAANRVPLHDHFMRPLSPISTL
jgi:hypothetical protein